MNGSTTHSDHAELLELYRISSEDLERIQAFAALARPSMDRMVSEWYEWLEKQPEYEQFFSDKETLQRAVSLQVEYWQTFMTGNYYYCFACQASCPVGKPSGERP